MHLYVHNTCLINFVMGCGHCYFLVAKIYKYYLNTQSLFKMVSLIHINSIR